MTLNDLLKEYNTGVCICTCHISEEFDTFNKIKRFLIEKFGFDYDYINNNLHMFTGNDNAAGIECNFIGENNNVITFELCNFLKDNGFDGIKRFEDNKYMTEPISTWDENEYDHEDMAYARFN